MSEIDKYLAIAAAVVIAVYSMIMLPKELAIGITSTALTGIFALAGTGPGGNKNPS